jgi:hypothetical protein
MAAMKKLLRMTVSAICYQRNIFPESYFEDESLGSLKVKMLSEMSEEKRKHRRHSMSQKHEHTAEDELNCALFQKWIEEGVMEAMGKKYLRSLVFAVFDGTDVANAKLHECYGKPNTINQ